MLHTSLTPPHAWASTLICSYSLCDRFFRYSRCRPFLNAQAPHAATVTAAAAAVAVTAAAAAGVDAEVPRLLLWPD